MDVHPPHEPIHSARDFFLHLFTITVGLLIALGLEGGVEAMHHRHLVREANADLREEVAGNRKDLEGVMATYATESQNLSSLLTLVVAQRAKDNSVKSRHPDVGFNGATLNNASYTTAQNDGAFALMPYADAKRYADIYGLQAEFLSQQRQAFETVVAPLMGQVSSRGTPIEKMDAAQLDDLQRLVDTYQGDLAILNAIARQLDDDYKKV